MIPMDVNMGVNGVDDIATRDSQTAEAMSDFIGNVKATEEEAYFVTGSSYKGSWDALGMAGVGRYVMPNGTVYEGEIRDGMFHGHGTLYWQGNRRLDVVHLRGVLQDHRYTFGDGLSYRDVDWSYCRFPDRRFYKSIKRGLRPAGRTRRTAKQPTKVLPSGCYDTGDGVFDPKTLCVTSYDDSTKVLRTPGKDECDWIVKNCRKSWSEPTGYRTSLIENWSDDPPELPYNLALSKDSPESWWKRLTTFARDSVEDGKEKDFSTDNENFELMELCMCGRYVILGEPCHCVSSIVSGENESHDDSNGGNFDGKIDEVDCRDSDSELNKFSSTDVASKMIVEKTETSNAETSSNYVLEIDGSATFLLRIPGEFPKDTNHKKIIENYGDLRKQSEGTSDDEQQPLTDAARTSSEDEDGKIYDTVEQRKDGRESRSGMSVRQGYDEEEEILHRAFAVNQKKNIGKLENSMRNEIQEKSTVEGREKAESADKAGRAKTKSHGDVAGNEKITQKSGARERREDSQVESEKFKKEISVKSIVERGINSEAVIIAKIRNKDSADDESNEQKENFQEAMEKSSLRNLPNKIHEEKNEERDVGTDEENIVNRIAEEKTEFVAIRQKATLKNDDNAATATSPTEKVPGATEPETTNDRETKPELLSKSPPNREYLDNVSAKIKSIEETPSGEAPPFYPGSADAIVTDNNNEEEKILFESGRKEFPKDQIFAEEFVQEKLEENIDDEKRLSDMSGGRNYVEEIRSNVENEALIAKIAASPGSDEISTPQDDKIILKEKSKTSVESGFKKPSSLWKMSDKLSEDLIIDGASVIPINEEPTHFPRKLDEENPQTIELTADLSNSNSNLLVTSRRESNLAVATCVVSSTSDKSLICSKYESAQNLEKLHPSFASISSTERKPYNEKGVIEIYNKFPRKEKSRNECSNPIVWRLSSALRDCSSRTKTLCHSCGLQRRTNTEDLHSGPGSSLPKSKPVECRRKILVSGICKRMAPEVQHIAPSCREKNATFEIPKKPDRSNVKHGRRCTRDKK